MERTKIFKLLKSDGPMEQVLIKGWVRTRRDSKGFSFIEINDGSSLKNIQVVADEKLPNYEDIKKLTTGSALAVIGQLVESKGGGAKMGDPGRRGGGHSTGTGRLSVAEEKTYR